MSQQTNISFYTEGEIVPLPNIAAKALRTLGIDEALVFTTKYKTLFNAWEHRLDGSLPHWEFNRKRLTLPEAVEFIEPKSEVVLSLRRLEDGLIRRFFVESWQAVPETLAKECIYSNNDCTFGMHDIFGMVSQAEEENTYIARAPFSVKFWGYRCPANIDEFRDIVLNLPVVSDIVSELSGSLGQPVKTAIYMNL